MHSQTAIGCKQGKSEINFTGRSRAGGPGKDAGSAGAGKQKKKTKKYFCFNLEKSEKMLTFALPKTLNVSGEKERKKVLGSGTKQGQKKVSI